MEEGIHHHSLSSPDLGALIGVASANRNVVLVDMGTGAACHTLRGHKGKYLVTNWSKETKIYHREARGADSFAFWKSSSTGMEASQEIVPCFIAFAMNRNLRNVNTE